MAASTIRRTIGVVKDRTSISLAKVAGNNVAPGLEVLVVKATSHDNEPADDKYASEILNLMSHSRSYVKACVVVVLKRLSRTHDWIVALKALMLVHRLLDDGDPAFGQELVNGRLNMEKAHSNSNFVRTYSLYLDQKVEFLAYERGLEGDGATTPVREMKPERVIERLNRLLLILDCLLACRPNGAASRSRIVFVALCCVAYDSFKLYTSLSEVLEVLLDRYMEMGYTDCVRILDAYGNAAKTINEVVSFHKWCKDLGVLRSSEFPKVQKISDELLGSLEGLLSKRVNRPKVSDELLVNLKDEGITDEQTGTKDPFAASLSVPPPSYVQMAEMERKQEFVMQEK